MRAQVETRPRSVCSLAPYFDQAQLPKKKFDELSQLGCFLPPLWIGEQSCLAAVAGSSGKTRCQGEFYEEEHVSIVGGRSSGHRVGGGIRECAVHRTVQL